MKNKRILCLILALITLFSFVSCRSELKKLPDYDDLTLSSLDDTKACTPLLYKATDGKGAVLYLFGSIHIGDKRTQSMPDYIMDAYNASSYICVEADIVAYEKDLNEQIKDLQKMRCETGKTIKDYLGKELYEDTRKMLQSRKLYNAAYDMYLPALWTSLVDEAIRSYTELESDYGVDRYFINKASADGKGIKEIESVDFQNDLMLGFSAELYRLMIADSVYYPEESVNSLNAMYEIWLGGDEAEIEEMLRLDYTGLSDEERIMCEDYNKKMLTDRNVGMADKAEQYLAEGGTGFFVVGAAHIVGEGAIVELLRDRGCTVEIVR